MSNQDLFSHRFTESSDKTREIGLAVQVIAELLIEDRNRRIPADGEPDQVFLSDPAHEYGLAYALKHLGYSACVEADDMRILSGQLERGEGPA